MYRSVYYIPDRATALNQPAVPPYTSTIHNYKKSQLFPHMLHTPNCASYCQFKRSIYSFFQSYNFAYNIHPSNFVTLANPHVHCTSIFAPSNNHHPPKHIQPVSYASLRVQICITTQLSPTPKYKRHVIASSRATHQSCMSNTTHISHFICISRALTTLDHNRHLHQALTTVCIIWRYTNTKRMNAFVPTTTRETYIADT